MLTSEQTALLIEVLGMNNPDIHAGWKELPATVAKLERVARAAKILEADYHCFDNSLPDVWDELEAALADLGAPGG